MKQIKRCRILAEKIAAVLREGLDISPQVLHYIDSTFSTPGMAELHGIINDESDSERDCLVELVFFPDEAVQIQMEDLLENLDFEPADEPVAADCLIRLRPGTCISFPDNRGSLELVMPESAAGQFIVRLKISKKLDRRLIEAIGTFVSEKHRTRCKVKVRNSRFEGSENNISFLCRFFEKVAAEGDDFFKTLEFMLNFFDEVPNDGELFTALMRRKRFYLRNLQKAEKFEDQMEEKNMETLMVQGMRIPYINKAEARKKIGIIDSIGLAVFGKTDYVGQAVGSMSVDISQSQQDVQKMMQLLS